jgi:hypothetical protein
MTVSERIAMLEAQHAEVLDRLAALEATRGLWPPAALALRRILAASTQGLTFTATQLIAHTEVDDVLAGAITGAWLECTPASIASWLRDHTGTGDGITIARIRRGRRWQVIRTSDTSSAASAESLP